MNLTFSPPRLLAVPKGLAIINLFPTILQLVEGDNPETVVKEHVPGATFIIVNSVGKVTTIVLPT